VRRFNGLIRTSKVKFDNVHLGKYSVSFKPSAIGVHHSVPEGVKASEHAKSPKREELDVNTKAVRHNSFAISIALS